MEKLRRNIDVARRNPAAVINGNFKGVSASGEVTVWVDAMGRVQRCSVAPYTARPGSEQLLAEAFMQACARARTAAENLEFAEPEPTPPSTHVQPPPPPQPNGVSRPQPRPSYVRGSQAHDDSFEDTSFLR